MMTTEYTLKGGVYLVVDPAMEKTSLLQKIDAALTAPVAAVQVWDHFSPGINIISLVADIVRLCHARQVPVLINNQWQLLQHTLLDGVHFDQAPANLAAIRQQVGRPFLAGLTCNNDLQAVQWADNHQLDYISFCSVFPSVTSNSCELVNIETVAAARQLTTMPIFLAGGIRPSNLQALAHWQYDGIAVVSGIMNAVHPGEAILDYYKALQKTN